MLHILSFALFCSLALIGGEKEVVLITGASKGIGQRAAYYLAERGYEVYGMVRDKDILTREYREGLHYVIGDVRCPPSIDKIVKQIIEKEGRIDVLINNAGYALVGPCEGVSDKEMQEQMEVNFIGPMRLCQAVLPHMRKQNSGRIINISSNLGAHGIGFASGYTASKAALEAFSESLSFEILPWNIKVSIIEPGLVITNFGLILGTRDVEGNPYGKWIERLEEERRKRKDDPDSFKLEPHQSAQELAAFIYQVARSDEPLLRYQTSDWVKEDVEIKLRDLSGEALKSHLKKYYE